MREDIWSFVKFNVSLSLFIMRTDWWNFSFFDWEYLPKFVIDKSLMLQVPSSSQMASLESKRDRNGVALTVRKCWLLLVVSFLIIQNYNVVFLWTICWILKNTINSSLFFSNCFQNRQIKRIRKRRKVYRQMVSKIFWVCLLSFCNHWPDNTHFYLWVI